jgi:RNA polymerase sigma factor (sigma-70 family)
MDEPEYILIALRKRIRKAYIRSCKRLGWCENDCTDWIEEVCGEGLALAYDQRDQWDEERGGFTQWAYLKTRELARWELQRHQRTQSFEEPLLVCEETPCYRNSLGEYLLKDELKGLLQDLTPDQKAAFGLYYVAEFEVPRIALLIGCSPKTVYTLLDRGRKKARALYVKLNPPQSRPLPRRDRESSNPARQGDKGDKEPDEPPPQRLPRREGIAWRFPVEPSAGLEPGQIGFRDHKGPAQGWSV